MIEYKAMQVSLHGQSERFSNAACSDFTPRSLSRSYFPDKNKVVPRSTVNPDHLEPFNCIGLFTTTHAIKHRSQVKSVEKACREQLATDGHSSIRVNEWNRLPDRNSEPGSIGIGLVSGLRTLLSTLFSNFQNKVVPRSAVNPDHLEPFICTGLFTTTHAIKHRSPIKSKDKTWHEQLVPDDHSSINLDKWCRLPDRNSGPGSIGIGQVPNSRTLFYELYL
jgi:hypothetical protein